MVLSESVVGHRNSFELVLTCPLERELLHRHCDQCALSPNRPRVRTSPKCQSPNRTRMRLERRSKTLHPDTLECSSPSSRCSLWSAAWLSCTSITTTENASRTCSDGAGISPHLPPTQRPPFTVTRIIQWTWTWVLPCHLRALRGCPVICPTSMRPIRMCCRVQRRYSSSGGEQRKTQRDEYLYWETHYVAVVEGSW